MHSGKDFMGLEEIAGKIAGLTFSGALALTSFGLTGFCGYQAYQYLAKGDLLLGASYALGTLPLVSLNIMTSLIVKEIAEQ